MRAFIEGPPGGVILLKYEHAAIARASFLLADQRTGVAALVDPQGDVERYLEDAYRFDSAIQHVFLTRAPDLPAAHAELRERTRANVYAGAWARPDPRILPVKDGDVVEFGGVRLQIVETPGHRLEGIAVLLSDPRPHRPVPYAAFTGTTALAGDVGRPEPELEDGFGLREFAAMLYDSLRGKILTLPDETRLLPSHAEGGAPDRLAEQRELNPGFQPMTKAAFVRRVTLDMADPEDVGTRGLRALSLGDVLRAQGSGGVVIDERDPSDFAAAHLAGSVNLPSAARFEPWAARLIEKGRPILLVALPGREGAAAARLARSGHPVAGFLEGGLAACEAAETPLRRERFLSFPTLRSAREGRPSFLVVDTRAWDRRPEGPTLRGYPAPLERLREELAFLPRGSDILICDDSPYRASAAASLLRREGFPRVWEVAGGLALWAGHRPPEELPD